MDVKHYDGLPTAVSGKGLEQGVSQLIHIARILLRLQDESLQTEPRLHTQSPFLPVPAGLA
jgi:hypothetical protein